MIDADPPDTSTVKRARDRIKDVEAEAQVLRDFVLGLASAKLNLYGIDAHDALQEIQKKAKAVLRKK